MFKFEVPYLIYMAICIYFMRFWSILEIVVTLLFGIFYPSVQKLLNVINKW